MRTQEKTFGTWGIRYKDCNGIQRSRWFDTETERESWRTTDRQGRVPCVERVVEVIRGS
jgi:hypothetical protein